MKIFDFSNSVKCFGHVFLNGIKTRTSDFKTPEVYVLIRAPSFFIYSTYCVSLSKIVHENIINFRSKYSRLKKENYHI